jgi:cytoskeletal protein CcmA (bactofilin family)
MLGLFKKSNKEQRSITIIRCSIDGMLREATSVIVGEEGSFVGTLQAERLEVAGTVSGQVDVKKLIILPGGRLVYDDLIYDELELALEGFLEPSKHNARRLQRSSGQQFQLPASVEPTVPVEPPNEEEQPPSIRPAKQARQEPVHEQPVPEHADGPAKESDFDAEEQKIPFYESY